MQRLPDQVRAEDPLESRPGVTTRASSPRDPALPPHLIAWTDPLFPRETTGQRRSARSRVLDVGRGQPGPSGIPCRADFPPRLRQPGIGLDHHARAFLALAIALRYEAEPRHRISLRPARLLLDVSSAHRAVVLGTALRLAYTLSAGDASTRRPAPHFLCGTTGWCCGWTNCSGVFAGESVLRRLDGLAQEVGLGIRDRKHA